MSLSSRVKFINYPRIFRYMDMAQIIEYFGVFWIPVLIVIILALTYLVQKILKIFMTKYIAKSSKILKVDKTHFSLMKHSITAIVWVVGISMAIYMIPALRTLAVSMLAGAGVLAVIIGFASQAAFSNIISGIFIAIFKPFRVGDIIEFSGKMGTVEDITLRHTVIKNFEGRRFVVPNTKISEDTIENFNLVEEKTCKFFEIGISYDSDIDLAIKIIRDEATKHPNIIDNRKEKDKKDGEDMIKVRVVGFGDSSVNLKAWCWADTPGKAFKMGADLNKSIKERFDKEGVEIPFPYRTVVYKKDIDRPKKLRKKTKKKVLKKSIPKKAKKKTRK